MPGAASRLLNYTSRRALGARRAGRARWFVRSAHPFGRVRVAEAGVFWGVALLFPHILVLRGLKTLGGKCCICKVLCKRNQDSANVGWWRCPPKALFWKQSLKSLTQAAIDVTLLFVVALNLLKLTAVLTNYTFNYNVTNGVRFLCLHSLQSERVLKG